MNLMPLALPEAELALEADWLPPSDADALFTILQAAIPWEVHRIRLFGQDLASPRLSCWIGDAGAAYAYSGAVFQPRPWPAALLPLRARLRAELGLDFNSVLANLYRDGRDSMGWHSDDEPELGERPVIASLSLGATRRFLLKARHGPGSSLALELPAGSLLLMRADTQQRYRHSLPRTAKPTGPRINLTFRRIQR